MWNKLSIRIKITLLTGLVLCGISVLSFILTIENAATVFIVSDVNLPVGQDSAIKFDFAHAQQIFQLKSFYIMLFVSMAGTFFMWLVSGRVLSPLKKLSSAMKNLDIQKNDQEIQLVNTQDEVGDLQYAFHSMLKNIRESYDKQKRFSQNAAHELKTPVAAIKTNLEVLGLEEEPNLEDYKEFVSIVDRQIERMNLIVQELRLLSSGETLQLDEFFPYKVVAEILSEFDQRIREKKLQVRIYFENQDFCVLADKVLMKQAISNVIHNALRYSNEGELVEIVLKKDKLSVKNYGVAIAAEDLEKIFEPFYCVDKSRSKKLGGSGLGLAITREIIEEHGFSIIARSQENRHEKIFTEFVICFGGGKDERVDTKS